MTVIGNMFCLRGDNIFTPNMCMLMALTIAIGLGPRIMLRKTTLFILTDNSSCLGNDDLLQKIVNAVCISV